MVLHCGGVGPTFTPNIRLCQGQRDYLIKQSLQWKTFMVTQTVSNLWKNFCSWCWVQLHLAKAFSHGRYTSQSTVHAFKRYNYIDEWGDRRVQNSIYQEIWSPFLARYLDYMQKGKWLEESIYVENWGGRKNISTVCSYAQSLSQHFLHYHLKNSQEKLYGCQ